MCLKDLLGNRVQASCYIVIHISHASSVELLNAVHFKLREAASNGGGYNCHSDSQLTFSRCFMPGVWLKRDNKKGKMILISEGYSFL